MENEFRIENMQIAEVELVYKSKVKRSELPKATSSKICYQAFMANWNHDRIQYVEESKVLLLNRSNRIIGVKNLSIGGMSSTIIDPKIVYSAALLTGASAIIVAHNHPSGELRPSEKDKQLTAKLEQAGALLDIMLLDHLIITDEGYFSFADEGLIY